MIPYSTAASAAQIVLAVLACLATLWVAQGLFAPIVLALVIGVVFAPMVDRVRATGIPSPLAALSGLLVVALLVAVFVIFLQPYVQELVRRAPILWIRAQSEIADLRNLLRGVEEVAESVTEALGDEKASNSDGGSTSGSIASQALPDMATALGYAPSLAGQLLVFIGTLFFFLLSRSEIYALVDRAAPRLDSRRLFEAEAQVSRYFLTIAMINAALGCMTIAALAIVGMPSPVLWGVLAFLMNFIPYLGPAIFAVTLAVAGMLALDGVAGFLPVACYMALNMTEGQFLTPALIGRSMAINPLLVFVSLTGWLWLWGPVGGIVAIPILVWAMSMTGWKLGMSEPPETPEEVTGGGAEP